jgi:hypothetical protein
LLVVGSNFAHGQDATWPLQKCIDKALENNIEIETRFGINYYQPLVSMEANRIILVQRSIHQRMVELVLISNMIISLSTPI